ncbi:MAG: ArsR family transcriptional regulator, partial [Pseudomonadota bacterium]
ERRAQDLADEIGLEKPKLKSHIRKLKELGLTESKQTGYKLSKRGQRVLLFATASDAA